MLSIVIPVYNEAENITALHSRVRAAAESLNVDYEVIVVDDGSQDQTVELLTAICQSEDGWKLVCLSRNFGHQTAVSAGMFFSRGDVVAVLDGDLQDPPEMLPQLLAKWREGFQVVYAIRTKRKEHIFKRLAYKGFYRILKRLSSIDIPLDAGDFCVMDRSVVDVLNAMPERTRFVRGLRSWVGFQQTGIEYERPARESGTAKYTLRKLVGLATTGIVSFSSRPLRMASWLGILSCVGAIVSLALVLVWWSRDTEIFGMRPGNALGWTSITSLVLFLAGLQMLLLGIIGEYLARVFDEVQGRPRWVVSKMLGFGTGDNGRGCFPGNVVRLVGEKRTGEGAAESGGRSERVTAYATNSG